MAYNYNINLNVLVKDQQLTQFEKRLKQLENKRLKITPEFNDKPVKRYWEQNTKYAKNYQKEQSAIYKNMENFQRDYSRTASELNRNYNRYRDTNSLGRRIGVAREKGSRLMDVGMAAGSYVGFSGLKKILYDTPVQAETNKWLLSTMGDKNTSADTLYKTLDSTTDKLPISMQSVAQPLYAFKSASGASADTINKIIPNFANFGSVVQNMTGSTELAETAMMKLAYGLQGRYAALDQYGITEKSLAEHGWKGDSNDIEGYMKAVSEIVGNAEDSMNTFAGQVKLVEKSLARTGKQIWESGLGDALKGVVSIINGVLNFGDGILAKFGVGAAAIASGFMGIVAASGYLLQAIGSAGEAVSLLAGNIKGVVSSVSSFVGMGHNTNKLEQRLTAQQNPVYVGGIHDFTDKDLKYSGFSDREKERYNKTKKSNKKYARIFGYGEDFELQAKRIKDNKDLAPRERRRQLKNLRTSRLNEIENMGTVGRWRNAGRVNTLRKAGGAFKEGFSGASGLSKITSGFSGMASVLGTVVGVINPVNIALGAFAVAIVALGSIFAAAYMKSESFRNHVGQLGDKLQRLGTQIMGVVGDVFQATGLSGKGGTAGVVEVAEKILSAVEHIVDWLSDITGRDYVAEEGIRDATEKINTAADRIKEKESKGTKVSDSDEDVQTLKWGYGKDWRNVLAGNGTIAPDSRIGYFSAGGGYWQEREKIYTQRYGQLNAGAENPQAMLKDVQQLAIGQVGIPGIGRSVTPVEVTNWSEQDTQAFVNNETNKYPILSDNKLNSTDFDVNSYKEASDSVNDFATSLQNIDWSKANQLPTNNTTGVVTPGQGTVNIQNGTNDISNQTDTWLHEWKNKVNNGTNETFGQIPSTISSNAPAASNASRYLGSDSSKALASSMGGMSSSAGNEAGKVPSAISSKTGQSRAAASNLGHSTDGAFGSLSWASKVSGEIGSIISNIIGGIPQVRAAVSQLTTAMNDQHADDSQIRSPGIIAKRYKGEMGYIAQFIKGGIPNINRSITTLVQNMNDTFSPFYDDNMGVNSLLSKNPVDIYNNEVSVKSSKGTPSVSKEDTRKDNTIPNGGNVINLSFNIERVDSEERVREIKDVIYETLLFNNETAGRNEPTPII